MEFQSCKVYFSAKEIIDAHANISTSRDKQKGRKEVSLVSVQCNWHVEIIDTHTNISLWCYQIRCLYKWPQRRKWRDGSGKENSSTKWGQGWVAARRCRSVISILFWQCAVWLLTQIFPYHVLFSQDCSWWMKATLDNLGKEREEVSLASVRCNWYIEIIDTHTNISLLYYQTRCLYKWSRWRKWRDGSGKENSGWKGGQGWVAARRCRSVISILFWQCAVRLLTQILQVPRNLHKMRIWCCWRVRVSLMQFTL